MQVVWKHKLEPGGETILKVSKGSTLLAVADQGHNVQAWIQRPINPAEEVTIRFLSVTTGQEFNPIGWTFVDTVLCVDGLYVVHVFVKGPIGVYGR